ncbi:hypothetical protein CANINC_002304 [Pichia inconspicua]|uniref:RING-type domain-containing protein n=1 Tax=Pichia inconspicua TaxID=52247 RepID=A0A4T0X362_9ASCO|nr:hypothetical protein CANINC_002304 [[Candida] inconspicua]
MSEQLECPICLDKLSKLDLTYTLTKPCNHFYHLSCIKSWSTISSSTCPRCRVEISTLFIVNKGESLKVLPKKGDKLADIAVSISDSLNQNQQINESTQNHLGSQICCICDRSALPTHSIICPQCAGLYHRSCSDGLNCPLCDEWIDNVATTQLHQHKQITTKPPTTNESYYVALVDELQQRQQQQQQNSLEEANKEPVESVDAAWELLDQIKTDSLEVVIPNQPIESHSKERKLKRPKRATKVREENVPLQLTAESLARLDSSTSLKRKQTETKDSSTKLSFTQKLVVQRLLLKPRLNSELTNMLNFTKYTELNKNLSHWLYLIVESDKIAISAINAIIELAERESYLPFINRKSFDNFYQKFKSDNIVTRFKDYKWNSQINEIIVNHINHEIDKTKNKLSKSQ